MTYFEATVLGLVQGLAEFLPISSSGHLALLQNWFGIDETKVLLFTVLLHVGTLISVFIMYWKDKLGVMIIVTTIPTAIIGFLFNDFFDSLYTSVIPIGVGLIITGFLLVFAEKKGESDRGIKQMNLKNAIFIGTVQGIAICPGISRSGSTLFGSLICNLDRKFAVKFVFLISIPSILGSAILEAPAAIEAGVSLSQLGPVLWGMAVAAAAGIFAIKSMIKIVSDKKLSWFSYYVWILGLVVVIYGIVA